MLSYKQWKSLNESALSSFNLGLSTPNNLGVVSQFGFEETKHQKKKKKKMPTGDGEIVDASSKKDEPKKADVDVEVEKGEDSDKPGMCGDCGTLCGVKAKSWAKKCMMCGKGMCGMKSKKKMDGDESDWSDEDDADHKDEDKAKKDDEDHEEDAEEGDEDKEDKKGDDEKKPFCMKSKKKMYSDEGPNTPEDIAKHEKGEDEDHDEEGEDHDYDHDEEEEGDEDHDHEEGDEDHDEEPEVSKPMMSKKKMLKGGQHKLDMNKDGKIDGKDFKLMHAKKAEKKAGKKDESAEEAWWNSVRSMLGTDPSQKFSDGLFTPLDTDNLYQAVRSED